jgi:hypothetical protein
VAARVAALEGGVSSADWNWSRVVTFAADATVILEIYM